MKSAKQTMIDRIIKEIEVLGEQSRKDKTASIEDKLYQIDVLLDTLKFLKNYEENVRVLNEHYASKGKWNREK